MSADSPAPLSARSSAAIIITMYYVVVNIYIYMIYLYIYTNEYYLTSSRECLVIAFLQANVPFIYIYIYYIYVYIYKRDIISFRHANVSRYLIPSRYETRNRNAISSHWKPVLQLDDRRAWSYEILSDIRLTKWDNTNSYAGGYSPWKFHFDFAIAFTLKSSLGNIPRKTTETNHRGI